MVKRSQKFKIDLYDTIDKKYVMRDTGMPEAARALGISYNAFTNAIYRGGRVKGRYEIIKTGVFPSKTYLNELSYLDKPMSFEEEFELNWNEAVRPFRIAYKQKAERDNVK